MFINLLLAGAALASSPVIVSGSRGAESDRRLLVAAMRAPILPRRAGRTHFCYDETVTDPDSARRVCRTRREWRRLGLDPVFTVREEEAPAVLAAN